MKRSRSAPVSLRNLPPFPPVAARLLDLLSNPSVDINDLAEVIGSDALFTARLLQRINSLEFGLANPVTDLKRAIALLGIDMTRQTVVTHAIGIYTKEALKTEELLRCWQHMVATAVLADVIAQACGEYRNAAFTAGMIHDIGRLGLLVAYPREYEEVLANAAEQSLDVLDFEADEFGIHHAEAGRMLVERWGLPQEFAVVTGRHHDPCEGHELDLLRIVHVACRLADTLGYDFVPPLVRVDIATVLAELPAHARERLQMSPDQLRGRIEARILDFDGQKIEQLPPETSLDVSAPSPEAILDPVAASPRQNHRLAALAASLTATLIALAILVWKLLFTAH